MSRYEDLSRNLDIAVASARDAQKQMEVILQEQDLLERTTVAIQQSRPLLSANSIKQCEELANSAIESVFGLPYKVEYSVDEGRFTLNKGEFSTDLADAEGGGFIAVISFVFQVYLLMKMGKRKFLAFDEAFTQISDAYFGNFMQFVDHLCKDLGIDILLVTHDQRVEPEMVSHDYLIKEGKAFKVK